MPTSSTNLRDNKWLLSRLNYLWDNYFQDMEETNPVIIKFGRYSKYRLGSIRLSRRTKRSLITITKMFQDESIPSEVVDQTIAHELVHYSHGFSSFRPRLHRYPHAGGIVNKELRRRGMTNLLSAYKKWVRVYRETL